MGLSDYKKYKFEKQLKDSETISFLLKKIDELEKKVVELSTTEPKVARGYDSLSEDEKKKIRMAIEKKTKPEDFINLFTGDLQEFNPNA